MKQNRPKNGKEDKLDHADNRTKNKTALIDPNCTGLVSMKLKKAYTYWTELKALRSLNSLNQTKDLNVTK